MKSRLFVTSLALALLFSAGIVSAQENEAIINECFAIYNGGNTCYQSDSLTVNKKVLNPTVPFTPGQQVTDNNFIENTNPQGPFVPANSLTAFRLYVTNTTNRELKNITITDRLPQQFMTYVTSDGQYNEQDRTTIFKIESLPAGETRSVTIQVMTMMSTDLPASPVCVANQAIATVVNERFFILPDETKESQDNARLCIGEGTQKAQTTNGSQPNQQNGTQQSPLSQVNPTQPTTTKGGLPVMSPAPTSKTPETGAESLMLAGLIPAGLAGYYIRRRTK